MTKIMFVCHGNICRSPMAEAVMKDIVNKAHKSDYIIESRSTSQEAIGCHIHEGTTEILRREHIRYDGNKRAEQLKQSDYDHFDYFILMDKNNLFNIKRGIAGPFYTDKKHKIHLLMEYVGAKRDVRDPWYTDNFEETFEDITKGCNALFEYIERTKDEEN